MCLIPSWHYKDTSVWKGDGLSANEFTLYLVRALYKENNYHICKKSTITTSSELSSGWKHDLRKSYQEYANDISFITSDKNKIGHIKKAVLSELESQNLYVNKTETEEYEIKQNGNESGKECKLFGSLLDTDKDISRRKSLEMASVNNLKYTFCNQKLSVTLILVYLIVYVASIFLYNSELWTLTETKKKAINRFNQNEKISRSTKGYSKKIDGKKSRRRQFDLGLGNRNDYS